MRTAELDVTTLDPTRGGDHDAAPVHAPLTATILWHPDRRRIGCQARLVPGSGDCSLSRLRPMFSDDKPLADPRVSRTPLQLIPGPDGSLELWPGGQGAGFGLDGRACRGGERIPAAELERGVILGLGRGALLLLQSGEPPGRSTAFCMLGASRQMAELQARIVACARRSEPLLITGASGTGKEMVAHALHQAGPRRERPFLAVNLAAVSGGTAPSQLFGHRRGAFTGADSSHAGFFVQAEGGTLLLDEIGACPAYVQHQLLRVLESGEVQPVGGELCRVDVRVLAATDSALEGRLGSDDFSGPLYFRIARTRLHIEPLRLRPADIAVQLVHFLERELRSCGAEAVLDPGRRSPWLALDVLQAALAHSWPGNTRELIGVAADLVDRFQKQPCCGLPRFAVSSPSPWESQRSAEPRDELELALRAHAFRLGPTARALGITVPTLHRRMAAHGFVRAHELQVERIREELAKSGSVGEAAATLCVSKHALKIRMNVLGLEA